MIWETVPNPNPAPNQPSTRFQVSGALRFNGGEGIVWQAGLVHFATKGDNRVWRYDPRAETVEISYEASQDPVRQLTGVDNIIDIFEEYFEGETSEHHVEKLNTKPLCLLKYFHNAIFQ